MRSMRAGVVTLAVILSACGGGTEPKVNPSPGGGGGGGSGGGASTSNAIDVNDNNFDPSATTVPNNTTVTWTFKGGASHNVSFANTSVGNSTNLVSGTFSKTFTAIGTYNYTCTNHPGMNGSVIVQ